MSRWVATAATAGSRWCGLASSPRPPRFLQICTAAMSRGYAEDAGRGSLFHSKGGRGPRRGGGGGWGGSVAIEQKKGAFREIQDEVPIALSTKRGALSVHEPSQPRLSITPQSFAGYIAGVIDGTGRFVAPDPASADASGDTRPYTLEVEFNARDASLAHFIATQIGFGRAIAQPFNTGVVVYECEDAQGLAFIAWMIRGRLIDTHKVAQLETHVIPFVARRMIEYGPQFAELPSAEGLPLDPFSTRWLAVGGGKEMGLRTSTASSVPILSSLSPPASHVVFRQRLFKGPFESFELARRMRASASASQTCPSK